MGADDAAKSTERLKGCLIEFLTKLLLGALIFLLLYWLLEPFRGWRLGGP